MIPYFHSLIPNEITGSALDRLLALGWYRMDQRIFTASHVGLDKIYRVHWLRFPLSEIRSHLSHRRIRMRNRNFNIHIEEVISIGEGHQELHHRYRKSIDFDGATSIEDCLFGEFSVEKNIYKTKCISVFDKEKLIASGYFDVGDYSAASILHFFDPDYKKYSLGKYLILLTIDFLKTHRFEFYYPGYVVEGNPKMNYKLFLGRESAQYFEPETTAWKYFHESLLHNKEPGL